MKLRNKQTGEIVVFGDGIVDLNIIGCKNVAEMIETGWTDYEEPKGNWTIDPMNENYIDDGKYTAPDELERYEELGLKFNTKEEAEKAVKKLKACKRLKDKGFKFNDWHSRLKNGVTIYAHYDEGKGIVDDLNMLFGGEDGRD